MENNLKIKVACCPDCEGYKCATPQEDYSANQYLAKQAEELKEEMGDYLTLDFKEYENIKNSGKFAENEISAYDFQNEYWVFDCKCTPICKEIRSFKDACRELNIPCHVPNFILPFPLDVQMRAFFMLTIITKALNEGWNPIKHTPIDEFNQVYYPYSFFNSLNDFPFKHHSRWVETERGENEYNEREPGFLLVFKNDGLAKYAGTQFRELYLDLYQYPESYLNRYLKK